MSEPHGTRQNACSCTSVSRVVSEAVSTRSDDDDDDVEFIFPELTEEVKRAVKPYMSPQHSNKSKLPPLQTRWFHMWVLR